MLFRSLEQLVLKCRREAFYSRDCRPDSPGVEAKQVVSPLEQLAECRPKAQRKSDPRASRSSRIQELEIAICSAVSSGSITPRIGAGPTLRLTHNRAEALCRPCGGGDLQHRDVRRSHAQVEVVLSHKVSTPPLPAPRNRSPLAPRGSHTGNSDSPHRAASPLETSCDHPEIGRAHV